MPAASAATENCHRKYFGQRTAMPAQDEKPGKRRCAHGALAHTWDSGSAAPLRQAFLRLLGRKSHAAFVYLDKNIVASPASCGKEKAGQKRVVACGPNLFKHVAN
jgi:hypothetical protein